MLVTWCPPGRVGAGTALSHTPTRCDDRTTTPDERRALHARALRDLGDLVAQVGDADLARPTPCAAWDLATLLAHVVGQQRGFAAAAQDGDAPVDAYAHVPFTPAAFTTSADALLEAFARSLPSASVDDGWVQVLTLLGRDPAWAPTVGG
ncbi:hypothetical protein GCM10028777_30120 [Angustibacter speluncae]